MISKVLMVTILKQRTIIAPFFLAMLFCWSARGAELVEVLPLTDSILQLHFNEYLRVLKKHECDVTYLLSNENSAMERKLIITVKRPTLRSLLRVVTNPEVRLKDVNATVYNMFGDRKSSCKIIPLYSRKFGNHHNAQTYYEWEIKRPKLFSKYEITWDLV